MEKKDSHRDLFGKILLFLYTVFMLWLLFFRNRTPQSALSHQEFLAQNLNLHPFRTIGNYLQILRSGPNSNGFRTAVINNGGNFFLFILPGILLPGIWTDFRNYFRFIGTCAVIIATIEVLQLFTMVGCCDIDDLILNLFGMSAGFLLFTIISRQTGKHKESNP